jgi:hypothetical protein
MWGNSVSSRGSVCEELTNRILWLSWATPPSASAELSLAIEIGDASYGLERLRELLETNF